MKKILAAVCGFVISALFLIMFHSNLAFAIPAAPGLRDMKMPDGSTVKARLIGDEFMSRFETADGFTIVRNRDGFFEYAVQDDMEGLVPSGFKVGKTPPPFRKHLKPSRETIAFARMEKKAAQTSQMSPSAAPQITGTQKSILLLIEYTDVTHATTPTDHNTAYFDNLYYGLAFGTVNNYLKDISYNQLSLAGGVSSWLTADNTKAYYGAKNFIFPDWAASRELVLEAVQKADASIDFSQYDLDSDTYVDHLIIIHAGPDAASSGDPDDIWSHKWSLATPYLTNDGVYVYSYAMNSEMTYMGIHAHELLHDFGAPDLYDYDYDGDPVSYWCIMDSGAYGGTPWGVRPTLLCGYLRYDLDAYIYNGVNGWLSMYSLTQNDSYTIAQISDTSGARLYKADIPSDNEYFLLENRQLTGYDASLTDSGIVIYHVDEDMPDGWGYLNDGTPDNSFYRISVEDPGGTYSKSGAAYSSEDSQTAFYNNSTPNSKSNNGVSSGVSITGISASSSSMTFTYGNTTPGTFISANPSSGFVPLTVVFTGTATGGTTPYTYLYDFGDGSESTEQSPTHIFTKAGYYIVTFTATDSDGLSSSTSIGITVNSSAPVVSVSASKTHGDAPLTVTFTGTATEGEGAIVSYLYDFDDGTTSTEQNPTHQFDKSKNYVVIFTATDADSESSSDTVTIKLAGSSGGGGGGGGCFIAEASYEDNKHLNLVDRVINNVIKLFNR